MKLWASSSCGYSNFVPGVALQPGLVIYHLTALETPDGPWKSGCGAGDTKARPRDPWQTPQTVQGTRGSLLVPQGGLPSEIPPPGSRSLQSASQQWLLWVRLGGFRCWLNVCFPVFVQFLYLQADRCGDRSWGSRQGPLLPSTSASTELFHHRNPRWTVTLQSREANEVGVNFSNYVRTP